MPNTTIWTDTKRIAETKAAIESLVPYLQDLHQKLKSINISLTKDEMINLMNTKSNVSTFSLVEYLKGKILENTNEVSLGGFIVLNKAKLKDLIELPDISEIEHVLSAINISKYWSLPRNAGLITTDIVSNTIVISNDEYVKAANWQSFVDSKYTYKTTTSKGDAITNKLIAVCAALNTWLPYAEQNGLSNKFSNGSIFGDGKLIEGINILDNNTCVPSVQFVQAYERI